MKLYTINCYGLNYGLGVDKDDAIKAYLFRHPELHDVDGIEDNLKAKLLLNDAQLEDIFAGLVHMNNDNGITTEMMSFIVEKVSEFGLDISVENTIGIYEVFESMLDEVSIYASYNMSIEDIIKCEQTIKEIETEFYEANFKVIDKDKYRVVDEKSMLKFIGFYELEDGNGTLQCDIEEPAISYVYDDPTGTITEYINGTEHRTFYSIGDFIDNEVFGRN